MDETTVGSSAARLRRVVGLPGSVLLGLGSILGTGVFVSIGIAAGIAGPAVILATALAGGVAGCNALSSAQLAASHPVSGGTYEYGYRYLNANLGFTAGWMFLVAKAASAATASLGLAGYLLSMSGVGDAGWQMPLALVAVALLTTLVAGGMQRSALANAIIVSVTLLALAGFAVGGLPWLAAAGDTHLQPFFTGPGAGAGTVALLHATALMFVAYTGYGRIATLGEEVRDPRRTIPRAIVVTLLLTMVIYVCVAVVGIGTVGAREFADATAAAGAPLEAVAMRFGYPGLHILIGVGAVTAMLGVLLNLLLGLSRVLLAMGRRGDMPRILAEVESARSTPRIAVFVTGAMIAALVLLGDIRVTWSLSAFTVLVYYAITNLAALRLPDHARLYPRIVSVAGLGACLSLAFWVDRPLWIVGLALIALGLIWRAVAQRASRSS